jgi:hypothetical protein
MRNATRDFQIMMPASRARALSVVVILSLLVGYIGMAALTLEPGPLDIALTIVKLVGLTGAILLFLSNYGQMSQRPESRLDEREAQIRNRAYVLTHQMMVCALFAAFFWVEAAGKLGWWLPDARAAAEMITAYAMASMALPAAILAWRDQSPAGEA